MISLQRFGKDEPGTLLTGVLPTCRLMSTSSGRVAQKWKVIDNLSAKIWNEVEPLAAFPCYPFELPIWGMNCDARLRIEDTNNDLF